jgi:hypothetical protein
LSLESSCDRPLVAQQTQPVVRDLKIPIHDQHTKKITEDTTEPFFSLPIVDESSGQKGGSDPRDQFGV